MSHLWTLRLHLKTLLQPLVSYLFFTKKSLADSRSARSRWYYHLRDPWFPSRLYTFASTRRDCRQALHSARRRFVLRLRITLRRLRIINFRLPPTPLGLLPSVVVC